jgi:Tn3 transposase DDE domain
MVRNCIGSALEALIPAIDEEIRDRSFENQRNRAGGLNLATAAIVLWNTIYLERAKAFWPAAADRRCLIASLAPLGWNHINLTGDYRRQGDKRVAKGQFRPLRRPLPSARRA